MNKLTFEFSGIINHMNTLNVYATQAVSDLHSGKYSSINNIHTLDLTRLDYLGLGQDPIIKDYMIDSINKFDVSIPASQLIFKPGIIQELENKLASWHGLKETLIFTSGFSANSNVIMALGLRSKTPHAFSYTRSLQSVRESSKIPTLFFADSKSHMSILNSIRTCTAISPKTCKSSIFTCGDYSQLEKLLKKSYDEYGDNAIRIILSDTIESSSGKILNIKKLYNLSENYDALLYLDEAHAVGMVGKQGAGVASMQLEKGCDMSRVLIMGTLTKAFSQLGGYVACENKSISTMLRMLSLQYIGSAPIAPWSAAALLKTLTYIQGDMGESKREYLSSLINDFSDTLINMGFNVLSKETCIVSVLIKDEKLCQELKIKLLKLGYNTASFVYPAVKRNEAVLRLSVCADITKEELQGFANALKKASEL